ncbi:MAG: hypothetical protein WD295_03105, partial [Bacteroidota bacterium]
MKKVLLLAVAVLMIGSSTGFAQSKLEKMNLIGLNPLGLIFKIYSGEYGRFLCGGSSEINIPFFYWAPLDELTIFGLGARYRMYPGQNGEGIFYGGGISFGSVSWDYTSLTGTKESVTAFVIGPEVEGGYRWRWESGFTLAPSLSLGYNIGSVKSADGTVPATNPAGLQWGIGL